MPPAVGVASGVERVDVDVLLGFDPMFTFLDHRLDSRASNLNDSKHTYGKTFDEVVCLLHLICIRGEGESLEHVKVLLHRGEAEDVSSRDDLRCFVLRARSWHRVLGRCSRSDCLRCRRRRRYVAPRASVDGDELLRTLSPDLKPGRSEGKALEGQSEEEVEPLVEVLGRDHEAALDGLLCL